MPFSEVRGHLLDIRESIDNIEDFLKQVDFESYCVDVKTKSAVERQMQIISEAAIWLKDDGEKLCPEIDWKGLRGMGNVLRHGYHRVEDRIVWDTVKLDLPLLEVCVDHVLSREGEQSRP